MDGFETGSETIRAGGDFPAGIFPAGRNGENHSGGKTPPDGYFADIHRAVSFLLWGRASSLLRKGLNRTQRKGRKTLRKILCTISFGGSSSLFLLEREQSKPGDGIL